MVLLGAHIAPSVLPSFYPFQNKDILLTFMCSDVLLNSSHLSCDTHATARFMPLQGHGAEKPAL